MLQRTLHLLLVCLLTNILVANFVCAQEFVTDGLFAFYSFDKNTVEGDELEDLWGENHGKIVGQPKSVTGKINEALEFNGTSDCVELAAT